MIFAYNRKGWPVAHVYEDPEICGWRWSALESFHGRAREKTGAIRAAESMLDKAGASYEWRARR